MAGRINGWAAGRAAALAAVLGLCACAQSAPVTAPVPTAPPTPSELPYVPSWPETYEQTSSGVLRIATVTCDGQVSSGSGFLVGPDVAVTAAHVVDGASSLSARAGTSVSGAEVLGLDHELDVALLRLDRPVDGHVFTWAPADPRVGDEVAAVGYPLGQPLSMTQGAVTSLDRRIEIGDEELRGLVQTDAAINPGNSGGPLMTLEGLVAGVVAAGSDAAGDAYAVDASTAQSAVGVWRDDLLPVEPARCHDTEPGEEDPDRVEVRITSTHPEAATLAQTFGLHADAINASEYETAFSLLTPSVRASIGSIEHYEAELDTSVWTDIELVDVTVVDATTDDVELRFRTLQDPEFGPDGQTCSDWTVSYRMVLDSGFWQIDRARQIVPPVDCSDEPF